MGLPQQSFRKHYRHRDTRGASYQCTPGSRRTMCFTGLGTRKTLAARAGGLGCLVTVDAGS